MTYPSFLDALSDFCINVQQVGVLPAWRDLVNYAVWSVNGHQAVPCDLVNPILNAIATFALGSC